MIREKVGSASFLKAYDYVRSKITKYRQERKRQKSVAAVVDPAQNAKRKIEKHLKKRDAKKQKTSALKAARMGAPMQPFEAPVKRKRRDVDVMED